VSASGVVRIEKVAAADVRPLRSAVLRPGTPPERLVYDGDEARDALHVAGVDDDGRVVGIASLCREPAADEPAPVDGWRLRGMATSPEARGRGLGARLLAACFDHVRAHGGGLLWCNAREVALGFYEKQGLETVGERFDIAGIGPHFVMRRLLPRLRPARADEAATLTALAPCASATTAERIESGARVVVVATLAVESTEQVAGFHVLEPRANGDWRPDTLFVAPRWAGRGVGRELLTQARVLAGARGVRAAC